MNLNTDFNFRGGGTEADEWLTVNKRECHDAVHYLVDLNLFV